MRTISLTPKQRAALERLQHGAAQPDWRLRPIQQTGSRSPLFCVHPASGSATCYSQLAAQLGPDIPLLAFETRPLIDVTEPGPSIPERAFCYANAMRGIQPDGPYHIAGYSMGSIIAFEIACQLRAAGEHVAFLGLIDGGSPELIRRIGHRSDALTVAGLARDCAQAAGVHLDLSHDEVKAMGADEIFELVRLRLVRAGIERPELDSDLLKRFIQGMHMRLKTACQYNPEPHDGTGIFFRSTLLESESARAWEEQGIDLGEPSKGWNSFFRGGLDVVLVQGYHSTLLNRDAGPLAAAIKLRLSAASISWA